MTDDALLADLPFCLPGSADDRFAGVVSPAFIDNRWVAPRAGLTRFQMTDPRSEAPAGEVVFADQTILSCAIDSAVRAFETFQFSTLKARLAILRRFRAAYEAHLPAMARAISLEMGAPYEFALEDQARAGLLHIDETIKAVEGLAFTSNLGDTLIVKEPVGVAALITPWNWPANQIACKVAPAIAAGCAMVLKPSEYAPLSASLFAAIAREAGAPDGVLNMVFGAGPEIGEALARDERIDVVSFTGSTRGGVAVARAAAPTVKRVVQELGGKSANILASDLEGSALEQAVANGVMGCFLNAGQSCDCPSRMLVPETALDVVERTARETAQAVAVGSRPGDYCGPLVNAAQYERVQGLIQSAIDDGARLIAGGPGRAPGFDRGYYAQPTIFSGVRPEMTIAREEVFGPVLSIIPYKDEGEAIAIANDSIYGLSGAVSAGDRAHAVALAKRLRTGMVLINDAPLAYDIPFGGYRQSGNGREWGAFGVEEFLETKAIIGGVGV